jgi:hypothetical protein
VPPTGARGRAAIIMLAALTDVPPTGEGGGVYDQQRHLAAPISAPARVAAGATRLLDLLVRGRLLLDLTGDRRRERDGHSAS